MLCMAGLIFVENYGRIQLQKGDFLCGKTVYKGLCKEYADGKKILYR